MGRNVPHELLFTEVLARLKAGEPTSVIRMNDGEKAILEYCKRQPPSTICRRYDEGWCARFGVTGITCAEIERRLLLAATTCTYFGSGCGIHHLLPPLDNYTNPMYTYEWERAWKSELFAAAGTILAINRDASKIEEMRDPRFTKARIFHMSINDWRQSDTVMEAADTTDIRLILLSGGPPSKYLAPALAKKNRVVLDIGQGADAWWWVHGVRP